jgi:hypothetical protein
METFPDEGDMDMVRSLKVYKEIGYKYMLMPDHVPTHQRPRSDRRRLQLLLRLHRGDPRGNGNRSHLKTAAAQSFI